MSKSDALKQLVREGLRADELEEELVEVKSRLEVIEEAIEEQQRSGGFFDRFF